MLGVFRTKVVEQVTNPERQSALEDDLLEKHFDSYFGKHSNSRTYFGINGFIAFSSKQIYPGPLSQDFPSFPRHRTVPIPTWYMGNNSWCTRSDARLGTDTLTEDYIAAKEIWGGTGWSGVEWEGTTIAVFQYIQLRERNYNCIMYDYLSSVVPENTYTHAFVASCFDDVPMYWGIDSEGSCIVTDVAECAKIVCGNTCKCIPSGTCMLIRVPVSAAPASSSSSDSG